MLRRLGDWLDRRRHLMAAGLLATAAGTAVAALAPQEPETVPVLLAARDLAGGHALRSTDVQVGALPPQVVPDGALPADPDRADGQVVTAAVRRGEALTDARVVGAGLLAGAAAGQLALPVALDGALPPGLVSPGDRVTLLAGSSVAALPGEPGAEGEVLVRRAVVLSVSGGQAGSGLLGGGAGSAVGGGGPVLVLAVDASEAAQVAGAIGVRPLSAALAPPPALAPP